MGLTELLNVWLVFFSTFGKISTISLNIISIWFLFCLYLALQLYMFWYFFISTGLKKHNFQIGFIDQMGIFGCSAHLALLLLQWYISWFFTFILTHRNGISINVAKSQIVFIQAWPMLFSLKALPNAFAWIQLLSIQQNVMYNNGLEVNQTMMSEREQIWKSPSLVPLIGGIISNYLNTRKLLKFLNLWWGWRHEEYP